MKKNPSLITNPPVHASAPSNNRPNVIWVDGPNTCGKDFFIDHLVSALPLAVPIHIVQVGGYIHKHVVGPKEPRRSFGFKPLSREKALAWVNAHVQVLQNVAQKVKENPLVVCICNRSFLSAFIYNLSGHASYSQQTLPWTDEFKEHLSYCNEAVALFLAEWDKVTVEYQLQHALALLTQFPGHIHQPHLDLTESEQLSLTMRERLRTRGEDTLENFDMHFARHVNDGYLRPPAFFTSRMHHLVKVDAGIDGALDFAATLQYA